MSNILTMNQKTPRVYLKGNLVVCASMKYNICVIKTNAYWKNLWVNDVMIPVVS